MSLLGTPRSQELVAERNREHIEGHVRSVDQQILDVLLRIEEILRDDSAPLTDKIGDVVKDVKPAETPLLKRVTGKGKK